MAEAKKTVKNVETKVKETAKKVAKKVPLKKETVKKAVKKTTSRSAKAPKSAVILQYAGKEIDYSALVKKATQLSKKALKVQPKDIKIYVKPEENMVYYVANGGEEIGSFAI